MRRLVCLALACAFAATAPLAADAPSFDPTTRLRPTQTIAAQLIDEGNTRSPTFRRLVSRLQRSDVIVYVSVRPDMRPSLGGSLRFLGNSATDRFVLVSLNGQNSRHMLVALLGHELQHAVEIADAPDVRNDAALADLYRRIGVRRAVESWDSVAAQRAGQTVRSEIMQRPIEDRLARHASLHDELLLEGGSIAVANR